MVLGTAICEQSTIYAEMFVILRKTTIMAAAPQPLPSAEKRLAADVIRSALFAPRQLDNAEWSKIEQFAAGKAREYRSAQLKRSCSSKSGPVAQTAQPRRFVKVRKRNNKNPRPCPVFSVTKAEFQEYQHFQRGEAEIPQWFVVDDTKGLEIMHNYAQLRELYAD